MTNHYYSKQPTTPSQPKHWTYTLRGHDFSFHSDSGVFSKHGVDFGSALLIESYDIPDHLAQTSLLDMGCGYGPIGLAYAYSYPHLSVEMVDVNERAVQLAKDNANLNRISNANIHESNLYQEVASKEFGVIISNPPIRAGKATVHQIIEEAHTHLRNQGQLVIVIQKKQGAPSAEKKMVEIFGNCDMIARDKGYWILVATKQA
ncbi:class I SAM-dependent methyltransferase [Granulicatella seriolae]|uniref:Class I SAM-dependent methyltransferase n=1 Tax=Granulicatella seriolae TaxID=2967226 RepID=A0ABT1WRD7_9LACT|nr:class I SAM-dependent methyltransferase [Granulicatella seriolae]